MPKDLNLQKKHIFFSKTKKVYCSLYQIKQIILLLFNCDINTRYNIIPNVLIIIIFYIKEI